LDPDWGPIFEKSYDKLTENGGRNSEAVTFFIRLIRVAHALCNICFYISKINSHNLQYEVEVDIASHFAMRLLQHWLTPNKQH